MGKKVARIVQKEEYVTVCDVCGGNLPPSSLHIRIDWQENCPYDDCFSDWGNLDFCSWDCCVEGASKVCDYLDVNEDFNYQSFTIETSGEGGKQEILPKILKALFELK